MDWLIVWQNALIHLLPPHLELLLLKNLDLLLLRDPLLIVKIFLILLSVQSGHLDTQVIFPMAWMRAVGQLVVPADGLGF